jgi:inhibitor of KinA
VRILNASDHSVLVSFGDAIAWEHHQRVASLARVLLGHPVAGLLNVHPSYASVLVTFDPRRTTHEGIRDLLEQCCTNLEPASLPDAPVIEVPVCYGEDFGPDLEYVASYSGLTCDEVIRVHASAEYWVYFLGFSPGFPYLGGMPPAIAAPRLEVPRKTIPAGSVAIGGNQTGIYPVPSAAGWRIIGRTPLSLFSPDRDSPALLSMDDRLRFVPISREEYERAHPAPRA